MIATLIAAASITVTSLPHRPYAETLDRGFAINGDLMVENTGSEEEELTELRMDAFDAQGRLLLRREVNENGTAPAIEMIPLRRVKAGERLVVFNPLTEFRLAQVPARVDYQMTFRSPSKKQEKLSLSITPRPSPKQVGRFPVSGRVLVWDGHDLTSHHRRVNFENPALASLKLTKNSARYGYDLIVINAEGKRSVGNEKAFANWLSFGTPVRATGDGVVVSSRNNVRDEDDFDYSTAKGPNANVANHVVIREADGSYALFGHLKMGSVLVKPGQRVRAGEVIGQIGSSGDSLFPHLHYQRMDGPDSANSEGIPTRFSNIARPNGERFANGYIDSGDIVIAK